MVLNFRAVITGVVIDIVGSFAGSILVLLIYSSILAQQGMEQAAIEQVLTNPASSETLVWMLILVGIFFDGLAGHVTARIAGFLEYWHVLAMLGLMLIIQFALGGSSIFPAWVQVTGLFSGTIAAFLMAYRVKQARASNPPN